MHCLIILETDQYHFVEIDTDIFNLTSGRYLIGHRYRYSKICSPIF